jgi:hypothetical protein
MPTHGAYVLYQMEGNAIFDILFIADKYDVYSELFPANRRC